MGQHKANVRYIARRRAAAFTLVEVLVVMALLVLLAGMITVVATGVQQRSRASRTQGQITLLGEAVRTFRNATGYFPLAVPKDAWKDPDEWNDFLDNMTWAGRWTQYFHENTATYGPEFTWDNEDDPREATRPTNTHMLAFQLEQNPEANKVFNSMKETFSVPYQKIDNCTTTPRNESWIRPTALDDNATCQIRHPLGGYRFVYQAQDAWGTPLRFWTGDILKWAKRDDTYHWDTDILNLLSSRLQQANWGFFIESAGKDGRFGWWGETGVTLDAKAAEDNIYSVGQ